MRITILIGCIFLKLGYSFSQFTVVNTNTIENLYEINVFNGEAFIVGNNNYLAKLDLQNNQTILKPTPGPDTNVVHSFNRIDTNTIFIVSSYPLFGEDTHFIYRSDNNCETWDLVFDTLNLRINRLLMFDSLEGVFVNSNYKQFRTTNGGISWDLENTSLFNVSALEKYGDSIVCMGMFENFAYSTDRGRTWEYNAFFQYSPTNYTFLNENSLLAVCGNVVTSTGNKGVNWDDVYLSDSIFLVDIKEKSGKVYSVGKWSYYADFGDEVIQGLIAVSLDSGQTWQYYNTGLDTWFQSIEFLNDSISLICGTNGVLIKYNYRDHNLGFKELNSEQASITLFPNPTTGLQELHFQTPHLDKLLVKLLNISGKELKTLFEGQSAEDKITIDLSSFQPGVYFVVLQSGSGTQVLKTQKL